MLVAMLVAMVTLMLLPQPAQAAEQVCSTSRDDTYFHFEVYLYKESEPDPHYDYYFVTFHMRDDRYGNDWTVCPTYMRFSISARQWGSPGNAPEILTAFQEPDAGFIPFPHRVSVGFYGIGVSLQIPAGWINVYQDSYSRRYVNYRRNKWYCTGNNVVFTMGQCAEVSIGFKVQHGKGIYVLCHLQYVVWRRIVLWINEPKGSATFGGISVYDIP